MMMKVEQMLNNTINSSCLSIDKDLEYINVKLIDFVCDTFEINKYEFIYSKTDKVCEFKLYIFFILKNNFGASSREIAFLYGITRHEVNRKLRVLSDYLALKFKQESYYTTLKFLQRVYFDKIRPSLTKNLN